jgi:hypothetical protein
MPAGILYFGVIAGPGLPSIEQEIKKCKDLIKRPNLVLISVETKHPGFNTPNPNFITDYASNYSMLSRRAVDLIKERYKIDTERIFHSIH